MNTLHYRSIIPVPRNILTAYDIDDDDYYYSEYDEYDDFDIFTDDVLVIAKDGVFLLIVKAIIEKSLLMKTIHFKMS